MPIRVNVQRYESVIYPGQPFRLAPGFHDVAVDKAQKYIIGVMMLELLCPFMARRADLHYHFGRVKILINGNYANVTMPILKKDPLNSLFGRKFRTGYLRLAEIH